MSLELTLHDIEALAASGSTVDIGPEIVEALARFEDLPALTGLAEEIRLGEYGRLMTFSKKVFIPLTVLCRDVCH